MCMAHFNAFGEALVIFNELRFVVLATTDREDVVEPPFLLPWLIIVFFSEL